MGEIDIDSWSLVKDAERPSGPFRGLGDEIWGCVLLGKSGGNLREKA